MVMYNVYVYAAQEDYVLHKWYEKSVSTKPKGKPSQGAHLASVRHVIAIGWSGVTLFLTEAIGHQAYSWKPPLSQT